MGLPFHQNNPSPEILCFGCSAQQLWIQDLLFLLYLNQQLAQQSFPREQVSRPVPARGAVCFPARPSLGPLCWQAGVTLCASLAASISSPPGSGCTPQPALGCTRPSPPLTLPCSGCWADLARVGTTGGGDSTPCSQGKSFLAAPGHPAFWCGGVPAAGRDGIAWDCWAGAGCQLRKS